MPEPAAVVGLGIVSALGAGRAAAAAMLETGRSGLGALTLFPPGRSAPPSVGEVRDLPAPPAGLEKASRPTLLLHAALEEALTDAGLGPGSSGSVEADLVLGTTVGGTSAGTAFLRGLRDTGRTEAGTLREALAHCPGAVAARACGVTGARWHVSSACSSGSEAIGLGVELLRSGRARRVVAGGYDALASFTVAGFSSLRLLSPDACRPFDRRRTGTALGEGAAVVVLEKASDARARRARVRALVTGASGGNDGYHLTRPHPEGRGLLAAMRDALRDAGRAPDDVSWVKAHGTGTPPNDLAEYRALRQLLGDRLPRVPVSSQKPLVGHTLGGSGAVEAVLAMLAMEAGLVLPTLGCDEPDPAMPGLDPVREGPRRVAAGPRVTLALALGFGGEANALVLEGAR
ncbi:MAG: beta-ketoacyl-[acyl-carrier-protein] synthase family protein [Planctomycetales bacterium]|nr:beta-ketoacyl-[acyl-carrier-protein] synthase family protein [Planctomycetales bacterium]